MRPSGSPFGLVFTPDCQPGTASVFNRSPGKTARKRHRAGSLRDLRAACGAVGQRPAASDTEAQMTARLARRPGLTA